MLEVLNLADPTLSLVPPARLSTTPLPPKTAHPDIFPIPFILDYILLLPCRFTKVT